MQRTDVSRHDSGDDSLDSRLYQNGVVAVLVIDDARDAVPVARALLAGGVRCIELTLRTPAAMEGVERICADVPEMVVGVGTVLTPRQVEEVKSAGAAFGVAPGMNPRVVTAAVQAGLPFFPGICTPTEIENALEMDCRILKFFPSEHSGGLSYLKSIAAPYEHLGVRFIPLGGIHTGNAESYLREPSVLALGGSWLGPRDLIRQRNWSAITELSSAASTLVRRVRLQPPP